MPHHVHDAQLNGGMRIDGFNRFRKALQPIDASNEDVGNAPVLQLRHHLQPELGPFGLGDPQAQHFLLAGQIDTDGQIDRLDRHSAVAHLDVDAVEIDDGVKRIQGAGLPSLDLVDHAICHGGNQRRRNLGAVHLFQVDLDLPHGHAASVERQNLVVEAGPACLVLGDQLRLEGAVPVAGNLDG